MGQREHGGPKGDADRAPHEDRGSPSDRLVSPFQIEAMSSGHGAGPAAARDPDTAPDTDSAPPGAELALERLAELARSGDSLDAVLEACGRLLTDVAAITHAARLNGAGTATLGWWGEAPAPLREATRAGLESLAAGSREDLEFGPAEELLDEARAGAARAHGVGDVGRLLIRASGKPAALIELFGLPASGPSARTTAGLGLCRRLLEALAERERAMDAVRGAASHIRRLDGQVAPTDDRLREFEERYGLLCRGSDAGLWDWDLTEDRVLFSARFKALLGFPPQELGDRPSEWFDRIHPDDSDRVELELLEHLDWQSPEFESEHRVLHRDGNFRWYRARGVALHDQQGKAYRIAGSLTDISDARQREDQEARDLMFHRLTEMPLEALFLDRVDQAMRRRARRPDRHFAVAALSLDGLDAVTRTQGIEASEELLLAITRRIGAMVRPGDAVGHVDELDFGILLDDVKDLDDALRVVERIRGSLQQSFPLGEVEIQLEPALGVALSRSSYESADELLRDARIALRRARREEVATQVFDTSTRAYAQSIAELEGDLRKAFDTRSLFLEYQPVVSLSDGRITGVEAFLRWEHPERGLISPAEFIPVAEEAGLLDEMGLWAVDRACNQMKQWIERYKLRFPPNIAINLSEKQLTHESFVPDVISTIEEVGLDPRLVRFDVSESTFMKDGPAAGRAVRALTDHGIRIAIDDFGTGYSSLSYLHRYPVGALKIDRTFISGSSGANHDWDVARTVIELARILELEVIAEGIETRDQFMELRRMGCQQAQGFFFSGPVAAAKAGKLIKDGYPLEMGSLIE